MNYLIGIIVALVGGFFYQRSRANSAEAITQNTETKEQLNTIDSSISKNDGLEAAEEQKQADLKNQIDTNKIIENSLETIVDFLNKK